MLPGNSDGTLKRTSSHYCASHLIPHPPSYTEKDRSKEVQVPLSFLLIPRSSLLHHYVRLLILLLSGSHISLTDSFLLYLGGGGGVGNLSLGFGTGGGLFGFGLFSSGSLFLLSLSLGGGGFLGKEGWISLGRRGK